MGAEGFLHRIAADEIKDRLSEVNRAFSAPAIVTAFPEFWSDYWPEAQILADAELLDLKEGAHDLVIHAMALHWSDDPVGQMIQCARALSPDGLFMAVMPGGETLNELREVLIAAETALSGGASPRVLPMGELRDWGALLHRAGLALPVADQLHQSVSYRDLFHLIADLRAMGETNALAARHRHPPPRRLFAQAATDYARRFPDPARPDRITASYDLVFLTGWRPHPSQQQPLRPGSARHSLADALSAMRTK